MIPTTDEVQAEIAALTEMKPNVRRWTLFGGDNWAAIDVQIAVLTEGLDEDDIFDRWPEPDDDFDVREAGFEARAWRDGEWEENDVAGPPSQGWAALVTANA